TILAQDEPQLHVGSIGAPQHLDNTPLRVLLHQGITCNFRYGHSPAFRLQTVLWCNKNVWTDAGVQWQEAAVRAGRLYTPDDFLLSPFEHLHHAPAAALTVPLPYFHPHQDAVTMHDALHGLA